MNFYNENDPKTAAWLRELIKDDLIPKGTVCEKSIVDVTADDVAGFTQCHLFSGIGGWSYALRIAGWPDNLPVWTGSCPCQPFSVAGKGKGHSDERHLWPHFRRLIAACKPAVIFGEQVASPLGREWLAGVRVDLEALGYEVGAADLCAAGVGAPNIRQRLYWVAYAKGAELEWSWASRSGRTRLADGQPVERLVLSDSAGWIAGQSPSEAARHGRPAESAGSVGRLADADGGQSKDGDLQRGGQQRQQQEDSKPASGLADSAGSRYEEARTGANIREERSGERVAIESSGACGLGNADDAGPQGRSERYVECAHQWPAGTPNMAVFCRDGKWRRFESGAFPLASGVPARMATLRGSGNAINPWIAAQFIRASVEAICEIK